MIQREAKEHEIIWDPEQAHTSFVRQFQLRLFAEQMRATTENMPDSEMVKRGVKMPGTDGEKVTVPVADYIVSVEVEAEEAKLAFWRAGGIAAVEAYVHGRQGISYAGEVPYPHSKTARFVGAQGIVRL